MSLSSELSEILFNNQKTYHGLDLGTYSSLWSYKREGGAPKTVDYSGNNRSGIPSLFWSSQTGREYVADEVIAYNGAVEDPLGICSSIKMKLKESEIRLHNKSYTPQDILKRIVERIIAVSKNDLQRELVDISFDGLVVGIPAAFTAAEKATVLTVLESVTKSQTIRLVPEPILAAISSSFFCSNQNKTKLIFDLGAGTFDVCVLIPNNKVSALNPYPYLVKKSDGLRIAGDIFDERMTELLITKLEKNPYTLKIANLKNVNHADHRLLKLIAREIKEKLSSQETTREMVMDSNFGMGSVVVNKNEFEAVIRADVQKTVNLAFDALKSCNLGETPDIDIILVGGSSNIPLVTKIIREKFYWIKSENIYQRFPEKAISLGAAIYAETPRIVDNTPVPYAYATDVFCENLNRKMLDVIVPQGVKLPYTHKSIYHPINDGQEALGFAIYEIYSSEAKELYEINEGIKTKYRFEHLFGKKVSKTTDVELTATLTKDGVLETKTDDHGVSLFGIQKNKISLEYKE